MATRGHKDRTCLEPLSCNLRISSRSIFNGNKNMIIHMYLRKTSAQNHTARSSSFAVFSSTATSLSTPWSPHLLGQEVPRSPAPQPLLERHVRGVGRGFPSGRRLLVARSRADAIVPVRRSCRRRGGGGGGGGVGVLGWSSVAGRRLPSSLLDGVLTSDVLDGHGFPVLAFDLLTSCHRVVGKKAEGGVADARDKVKRGAAATLSAACLREFLTLRQKVSPWR